MNSVIQVFCGIYTYIQVCYNTLICAILWMQYLIIIQQQK